MGINKLNKFLEKNSKRAIKRITLYQLKGKSFAVDYSIYYYKFKKSRTFINLSDSFQKQIDTFRLFNIEPIYIFDGKPDPSKQNVIDKRNEVIKKYQDKISNELSIGSIVGNNNFKLMEKYKKKTVKLNKWDVNLCKELFTKNNIEFIQAIGEADELCCELYKNNKVSGIFSEDNDLLLGGSVIYKGLNNKNDIVYEYSLKKILSELKLPYDAFLRICLLAGTSYTEKTSCIFELYENYKKNKLINTSKYKDKEILYKKNVRDDIIHPNVQIAV